MTQVIDLREYDCALCGTPLGVEQYEGDPRLLRCEECADLQVRRRRPVASSRSRNR